MKHAFEPKLRTDPAAYNKEELNKRRHPGLIGTLGDELRSDGPNLSWEAEQLAKSHGIYLEFNRAKTGKEKDWMYMLRLANPGGGPIGREQWRLLDELAERHTRDSDGHSSLRLTTRQTIQLHWLSKAGVLEIVRTMGEAGLRSLNGCGDNVRNVLSCPLALGSDACDTHAWARRAADYFQLPVEPHLKVFAIDPQYLRQPGESFEYGPGLLNRKFKIAFSALHPAPSGGQLLADNCVELLTNDLGVAPIAAANGDVQAFQLYVGGGQGERNGKPTTATLALPLAVVSADELLATLDAVVQVQQEWGDRQNRHWARLKYVLRQQGIAWFREQVGARLGHQLLPPEPGHDPGARQLHHGWSRLPGDRGWAFGAFIENGRLTDASANGRLKTMVRQVMERFPVELMVTANQDLLFCGLPAGERPAFEAELRAHGYGERGGRPYSTLRRHSGACVGRDTCRLTYTDSERLEPELLDELEARGWGELAESIGITGCERQCFRPATKAIGLVGSGFDLYQLKLFGDESGRFQGRPLISSDGERMYLRQIPRTELATVIDSLFRFHRAQRAESEGLGACLRRRGPDAIIAHLTADPATAPLMQKSYRTDDVLA